MIPLANRTLKAGGWWSRRHRYNDPQTHIVIVRSKVPGRHSSLKLWLWVSITRQEARGRWSASIQNQACNAAIMTRSNRTLCMFGSRSDICILFGVEQLLSFRSNLIPVAVLHVCLHGQSLLGRLGHSSPFRTDESWNSNSLLLEWDEYRGCSATSFTRE